MMRPARGTPSVVRRHQHHSRPTRPPRARRRSPPPDAAASSVWQSTGPGLATSQTSSAGSKLCRTLADLQHSDPTSGTTTTGAVEPGATAGPPTCPQTESSPSERAEKVCHRLPAGGQCGGGGGAAATAVRMAPGTVGHGRMTTGWRRTGHRWAAPAFRHRRAPLTRPGGCRGRTVCCGGPRARCHHRTSPRRRPPAPGRPWLRPQSPLPGPRTRRSAGDAPWPLHRSRRRPWPAPGARWRSASSRRAPAAAPPC